MPKFGVVFFQQLAVKPMISQQAFDGQLTEVEVAVNSCNIYQRISQTLNRPSSKLRLQFFSVKQTQVCYIHGSISPHTVTGNLPIQTSEYDEFYANYKGQLLSKHGVRSCSAILCECQMKQMR